MASIHPISKLRHGAKHWKRYTDYQFAARETSAPLVVAEFAKACMSFPIAFVRNDDGYSPIGLLGLVQGQNAFVAKNGRWIGGYIPAAFRGYPFRLGKTPEGQRVLCIDEESGLLVASGLSEGSEKLEMFFSEDGAPTQEIKKVLEFLSQVEGNKETTVSVCDLLEVHKLIEPWPVSLKTAAGEQKVEGLFRISEPALKGLKSKAVTALHKENALMPAYCQVLSMQAFPVLGQLLEIHAKAQTAVAPANLPPPAPSGEIDFSFLSD